MNRILLILILIGIGWLTYAVATDYKMALRPIPDVTR